MKLVYKILSSSLIIAVVFLSSCVPMRKFEDLQAKYRASDSANKICNDQVKSMHVSDSIKTIDLTNCLKENNKLRVDSLETMTILNKQRVLYKELNETYERELKFMSAETQRAIDKMKDLEAKYNIRAKEYEEMKAKVDQLKDEEKLLQAAREKLESEKGNLSSNLKDKELKLAELQNALNSKDSVVKSLKNIVSNALLGFKEAGLEVNIKNGKVYVSLSEQLLFASGKTDVDKEGKSALLQLAKVLEKQNNINILVEGHTDDVPIKTDKIQDNWELSVMRANSIVRILTKDGKIDPTRVIAAGRGQYMPIDPAKTPEARRKNRRTEIILTPKLDELLQIIDGQ